MRERMEDRQEDSGVACAAGELNMIHSYRVPNRIPSFFAELLPQLARHRRRRPPAEQHALPLEAHAHTWPPRGLAARACSSALPPSFSAQYGPARWVGRVLVWVRLAR